MFSGSLALSRTSLSLSLSFLGDTRYTGKKNPLGYPDGGCIHLEKYELHSDLPIIRLHQMDLSLMIVLGSNWLSTRKEQIENSRL